MIAVIEGMDASGKATHSKLLAERMKAKHFSFPNYESVTGKVILGHLKKAWACRIEEAGKSFEAWQVTEKAIDALAFQALQTANRLEIMPDILAAQKAGAVVFDRYWQSAVVYGVLDGLSPELTYRIQAGALPQADANILIDIPVEEGFKRRPERRDRYEEDAGYLGKVRSGYLRLWGERGDRGKHGVEAERWLVVDGMGTVEEVAERINNAVVKAVGA
jgi:thymidylate kinase